MAEREEWPEGSFTVVWDDQGRKVPITVVGLSPKEEERLAKVLAEFLWKHRHLAHRTPSQVEAKSGCSEVPRKAAPKRARRKK
jgi:hypothetical protein